MLHLKPGDIVLVRGRSWRHRLLRVMLRYKWNHVAVGYKDGEVQELDWRGTHRKSFERVYGSKQIIVLRLQALDSLSALRRDAAFINALDNLMEVNFDWTEYVRRCLRLKPRNLPTKSVCDAYISRAYREAWFEFDRGDFSTRVIDCADLMRKDYTGRDLLRKYNLVKVYDYRGYETK